MNSGLKVLAPPALIGWMVRSAARREPSAADNDAAPSFRRHGLTRPSRLNPAVFG